MTPDLIVAAAGRDPWSATATWRDRVFRGAVGRAGIGHDKVEGDGRTPAGRWPMRRLHYRADRFGIDGPPTALRKRPIQRDDGWCDDPRAPAYNRLIRLPFGASHEDMWRGDALYDLVVELGYNDDPPVSGRGSAVFLHIARPDLGPTAGCVALAAEDLLSVLAEAMTESAVRILAR
jgi:L,D-peptidoglycan transpeptidase YkuD (ErfK/YbiS/YcfS/YnhG family)